MYRCNRYMVDLMSPDPSLATGAVSSGAKVAGQASGAYNLSKASSGGGVTSGIKGAGQSFASSLKAKASAPLNAVKDKFSEGQKRAWETTGENSSGTGSSPSPNNMPANNMPEWAKKMQRVQRVKSAGSASMHAMKEGDRPGSPANPSLNSNNE